MGNKANKHFQKWYQKNKGRIAERRRERYHNDPVYRERVLSMKRQNRAKNKKEHKTMMVGGKSVQAFRIGEAAEYAGTTVSTIREWDKKGVIPETVFDSKHRYYTKQQCQMLRDLTAASNEDFDAVADEVRKNWKNI